MEESAVFFEAVALGVQRESRSSSYRLSLAAVEAPLHLWPNMTIVDVAVIAGCELFLTAACREAIEQRFAGDLLAYGQRSPLLGFNGLKYNVLWNLVLLGVGAPWNVKYRRWPAAECLRYPTQRMQLEKSVYDKTAAQSAEAGGGEEEHWEEGEEEEADVRPVGIRSAFKGSPGKESRGFRQSLKEWWFGTEASVGVFVGWKLFWQAPVTLFLVSHPLPRPD
eukprot:588932-Rhodomonas_salina.2